MTLDKNEALTYQEVIEVPGKTKQQLYVALNYWVTATFKDKQASLYVLQILNRLQTHTEVQQ